MFKGVFHVEDSLKAVVYSKEDSMGMSLLLFFERFSLLEAL